MIIFVFYLWHLLAFYFLDKFIFILSSLVVFPSLFCFHRQAIKPFIKYIVALLGVVIFYFLVSNLTFTIKPWQVRLDTTHISTFFYQIMLILYLGYAVYRYKFSFFIGTFCRMLAKFNTKLATIIYLDSKLVINNLYRLKYAYMAQSSYLKNLGKNRLNIALVIKQFRSLLIYSFKELNEQEMVLGNLCINEEFIMAFKPIIAENSKIDRFGYIWVWFLEMLIYTSLSMIK